MDDHDHELVLNHHRGGIECLSFLSRPHMSPKEAISIPFYGVEDEIHARCCRGLFFFDNFQGKAVVINLTTKEFKLFTKSNPEWTYGYSGLGYDAKSDDYKVIRIVSYSAEVFSFKNNSWKLIPGPGVDIVMGGGCGVYVEGEGRCYWPVWTCSQEDGLRDFVLCFDFTHETFSRFSLPTALRPLRWFKGDPSSEYRCIDLFDCDGCLCVVGSKNEEEYYKSRVSKQFEVWVYREGSWVRSFGVILVDVGIPVGLRDGRMFLEGKSSNLMVYDWAKEELREHDICGILPKGMHLFYYVENRVVLPDAKPLLINGAEEKVLKRFRRPEKKVHAEHSPEKVLERCRRREKEHVERSVLKRCRRREKRLKK